MPYSKEYNEEKHSLVAKYIEQLQALEEGRVLLIPTSSKEEAQRMTWFFHDYLKLIGCTSLYRINQLSSYIALGTRRNKITLSGAIAASGEKDLSKNFIALMEEMISSGDGRAFAASLLKESKVSLAVVSALLAEYSRVMQE